MKIKLRKDYKNIYSTIIQFLKKQLNGKDVVIGVSGGVDSSLCAVLACKALGRKHLHLLVTPSKYTPKEDFENAFKLAKKLSPKKFVYIKEKQIEKIRKAYDTILLSSGESEDIIMDAYIRNNILRRYSRLNNCRVIGTINGTEWRIGYFPKYTLVGDVLPIADLYKTQVFGLAEYVGIDKKIIDKKPTLGLGCVSQFEEELSYIDEKLIKSKVTYEKLDIVLASIDKGLNIKEIIRRTKDFLTPYQVKLIYNLVKEFEHKRKLPPYPKIN